MPDFLLALNLCMECFEDDGKLFCGILCTADRNAAMVFTLTAIKTRRLAIYPLNGLNLSVSLKHQRKFLFYSVKSAVGLNLQNTIEQYLNFIA
jgi:hypothetical protein